MNLFLYHHELNAFEFKNALSEVLPLIFGAITDYVAVFIPYFEDCISSLPILLLADSCPLLVERISYGSIESSLFNRLAYKSSPQKKPGYSIPVNLAELENLAARFLQPEH